MDHTRYGLRIDPIVMDKDYVLGGYGSIGGEVLQPDGNWSAYLPVDEYQNLNDIEPYACASFGTHNAIEILIKRIFGTERNYSDRFLAKASGTTNQGNSPHTVAETLRKTGTVTQAAWPFDGTITTFAKFYADIPRNVFALATAFFAEFDFKHEYVPCDPASFKTALTKSPLGVSVYAWVPGPNGIYIKPQGVNDNHWVVIYHYKDGQYWDVFDSYDNTRKKYAWDAQFQIAKRYSLTRQITNETWWTVFKKWLREFTGLAYGHAA